MQFSPGFKFPTGNQLNALSVLKVATMALTNVQMLSLFTSPITLIPAPGHNQATIVISSVYQVIGSGFTSSDSCPGLYYGSPATHDNENIADGGNGNEPFVVGNTTDQVPSNMTNLNIEGGFGTVTEWAENVPVILANPTANMTGSTGSGRITALYYVIPLS